MKVKTTLILAIVMVLMSGCSEQELDCKDPLNKEAAQCKHESMIEHSSGKSSTPKKW